MLEPGSNTEMLHTRSDGRTVHSISIALIWKENLGAWKYICRTSGLAANIPGSRIFQGKLGKLLCSLLAKDYMKLSN